MNHYQGIYIWTEVICGHCATATLGEFVHHGRRQMRPLMTKLMREGWTVKDGIPYCPQCMASSTHVGAGIHFEDK